MNKFKRRFIRLIVIPLVLTMTLGAGYPALATFGDACTTEEQTVAIEDNMETNASEEPNQPEGAAASEEPDQSDEPAASEEPDESDEPAASEEPDEPGEPAAFEQPDEEESQEPNGEVVYDPQPVDKQEVQAAIDIYEAEYQDVIAREGFLAALKVSKPHWQYEVLPELIPNGYNCQLVDWDEDFGAEYYTFFISPEATAFGQGGFLIKPEDGPDVTTVFQYFVGNTLIDSTYSNVAIATLDARYRFGAMWAGKKLDLSMPFSTKMELHLGHSANSTISGPVADGMTFTMHNYKAATTGMIGGRGEGLGVWTGRNNDNLDGSYLPNALVIEFDTYRNQGSSSTVLDPASGNLAKSAHCALIYPRINNRENPITADDHKNTYYFEPTQKWIPFTVKWEPGYNEEGDLCGILTYSFDGVEQTEEICDVEAVFGGTEVWWGFTGATGLYAAVQAAAIIKLPSPQYNLTAVKSVDNKDEENIDGKYAKAEDTLTYTIRVTGSMTDAGSRIGPISIEDELSDYVEYIDGDITVTKRDSSQNTTVEPDIDNETRTLTVDTGRYIEDSDDWLEITFAVKVKKDTDAGTVVENTAIVEAGNLEDPVTSNTTKVTIKGDTEKTVVSGSAGYNGATVTIGDEITYNITYFNSSDSAADLVITDSLQEGVVYVEDSADNDGTYDSVNHQMVWNLDGIEAGTGGSVQFTVKVTGDIDRDEELVNTALLEWSNGEKEDPSTKNPVAGYKVIYNGNGGVIKPENSREYMEGLFAIGDDYTVVGNDKAGFAWAGHTFLGWNTAKDGSGDDYERNDIFYAVTSDITLYAQWGRDLVFRKIDVKSVGNESVTALTGSRFILYKCIHFHDNACGDPVDLSACSHTHTPLEEGNSCWDLSSHTASYLSGSIVTFSGLTDGAYLLMETTAPDGYQLPKGQWIVEVESGVIAFTGISGDSNIPAVVEKSHFNGKEADNSVEFWIGNIRQYQLPIAGHDGTFRFTVLGGLLIAVGLLTGIWYYRRRAGNRHMNRHGC